MTEQQHTITPPPELVQRWQEESLDDPTGAYTQAIANRAAQWGADQELEACRMEIIDGPGLFFIEETSDRVELADELRSARRPRPPSLKEQALGLLEQHAYGWTPAPSDWNLIRRAIESIPDPS